MSRAETNGKRTCFEAGGHRTKSGQPCSYFLAPGQTACIHHAIDKTRQHEILAKAQRARKEAAIPDIDTHDFKTIDDCLAVKAGIVKILCRDKAVDFRRLELALKCATSASGDHATKATEEQNRILLQLDGHGAGIAVLQRLREAPVRVLPGRRKVLDLEVIPGKASPDKRLEPSNTTTDSHNETQEA